MTYTLRLRPRALAEIEVARDEYSLAGQGGAFLDELDSVMDAIEALPLRFPVVFGSIHRALLRRFPFAVFFRIRPGTTDVVVLAVFPQRGDPARWPKR